jgi:hypothetical protein
VSVRHRSRKIAALVALREKKVIMPTFNYEVGAEILGSGISVEFRVWTL